MKVKFERKPGSVFLTPTMEENSIAKGVENYIEGFASAAHEIGKEALKAELESSERIAEHTPSNSTKQGLTSCQEVLDMPLKQLEEQMNRDYPNSRYNKANAHILKLRARQLMACKIARRNKSEV